LIEVVVATAILTIGVAVVARAFSQCAQAATVSSDVMKAVFLASNRLEEWELKEKLGALDAQPKAASATVDAFNLGYALNPESATGLYGLDLNVSWERLRARRSFNLATYLR
jgi:Tfp pilus assembly protein PilV